MSLQQICMCAITVVKMTTSCTNAWLGNKVFPKIVDMLRLCKKRLA